MASAVGLQEKLGPYVVTARIGAGGMGEVWRARDERLGRDVAIKVLPVEAAADADRMARFEREARALAALSHPSVLAIHDVGREGDVSYVVTELLEGETLRERLGRERLPWRRVVEIAASVADGLAAAHGKGIVHRDLKPENLFVARDGSVKILDFGLARLVGAPVAEERTLTSPSPATAPGLLLGTVGYMAPEQVRGEPADARTDLFALGCVVWEMLTGQRPFRRATAAETLTAVLREPIAEPSSVATGIPPGLDRLVMRCLAKAPGERFQSASDLAYALRGVAAPGRADSAAAASGPPPGDRSSIAVLPFANLSADPTQEYFCDGVAEEILNSLAHVRGLRVIARTSAFAFKGRNEDTRVIGSRLGVATLLEGSVRRSGDRFRITVQLVDASDGSHLWSERYDRDLRDVLDLEDEIAASVARRMREGLAAEGPVRRRQAVDPAAHQAYLEGRYHLGRSGPEALSRAKERLENAVALEPGFALAYDALAELYWFLGFFGGAPPRDAFGQSTWYAVRALELDDGLAGTHALLAMLRKELDYNWEEVERENARARELDPFSPAVRLRCAISGLLPHGRLDEALVEVDAVLASDPLSILVRWWSGVLAYLARRAGRALGEARHMLDLDGTHFLGHWLLAMGRDLEGDRRAALKEMERASELSGGIPFTLGFLAFLLGGSGDAAAARSILEGLRRASAARYVSPFATALAHVGLGEWDAAFDAMDAAVEQRDPLVMPARTYPFLDPVRDHPRYGELLRKMRLA